MTDNLLAGRVALVTGATSGFGAATAEQLARAGARVIATGRRQDRLDALSKKLGAAIHPVILDVRDLAAGEHTKTFRQRNRLGAEVGDDGDVAVPVGEHLVAEAVDPFEARIPQPEVVLASEREQRMVEVERRGGVVHLLAAGELRPQLRLRKP